MTRTPYLDALRAAATRYLQRGLHVHPVHGVRPDGRCTCGHADCSSPGKHPRTRHGFKDATLDGAAVERWIVDRPDMNIAIATGASSLLVVDIDPRHGGDETWRALTTGMELGLPWHVSTGGGGRHLYYRGPGPTTTGHLGPGVDTRGVGGYVVAPPSRHASGDAYRWLSAVEDAPSSVPNWLQRLLVRKSPPAQAPSGRLTSRDGSSDTLRTACSKIAGAEEGTRHTVLAKWAFVVGRLIGAGRLDESQCMLRLQAAGRATGLPAAEVGRTVRDQLAAGRAHPWEASSGAPRLPDKEFAAVRDIHRRMRRGDHLDVREIGRRHGLERARIIGALHDFGMRPGSEWARHLADAAQGDWA